MTHHHSSLNPEFDEANAAILEEIALYDLKCNKCGMIGFYSSGDKEGDFCFATSYSGVPCPGVLQAHDKPKLTPKFADGLVCGKCGTVYEINNDNKPGYYCTNKLRTGFCDGQIYLEKNVIKLPESVKSGKKGYHTGGGTAYNTTWESHKHPGDKVIFEHDGKKLYASNSHSLEEKSGKWGLIIDLAGVVPIAKTSDFIRSDMPPRFKALKQYLDKDEGLPSEVLRLFWSDMGVPPAGIEFWMNMWTLLPEKTVIACQGGHGRTGTALASLMIAAGMDYYSALDDVRTLHCKKAVETLGQEQYLHCIYLEYLNHQMTIAKQANNLLEVKDITEDIEYAMKNKPTYQSRVEVKGQKVEGNNQSLIPFTQTKTEDTSTDDEFDDEMVDKHTKVIGEKIYVEECTNQQCTEANCTDPDHLAWVPWDYSNTEVW